MGTSGVSGESVDWLAEGGEEGGGGGGGAVGGGGTISLLCWSVSSASEIMKGGCSGWEFSTFVSKLSAAALEVEEMSPSAWVRGVDCFPGFLLPLEVPDVPVLLGAVSLEAFGWDVVDEGDCEEDDLETDDFFTWEELAKMKKDKHFTTSEMQFFFKPFELYRDLIF